MQLGRHLADARCAARGRRRPHAGGVIGGPTIDVDLARVDELRAPSASPRSRAADADRDDRHAGLAARRRRRRRTAAARSGPDLRSPSGNSTSGSPASSTAMQRCSASRSAVPRGDREAAERREQPRRRPVLPQRVLAHEPQPAAGEARRRSACPCSSGAPARARTRRSSGRARARRSSAASTAAVNPATNVRGRRSRRRGWPGPWPAEERLDLASSARRSGSSRSMRSTTSSIVRPVVSTTTAPVGLAQRAVGAARCRGGRARRSTPRPRRRRRRSRRPGARRAIRGDAVTYSFSAASGNTTDADVAALDHAAAALVGPLSLTGAQLLAHRRVGGDRADRLGDLAAADRRASRRRRRRARRRRRPSSSSRRRQRRRPRRRRRPGCPGAARRTRRPGTSRRCRGTRARAAAASARPTVLLPAPAGPSMAMTSRRAAGSLGRAHQDVPSGRPSS